MAHTFLGNCEGRFCFHRCTDRNTKRSFPTALVTIFVLISQDRLPRVLSNLHTLNPKSEPSAFRPEAAKDITPKPQTLKTPKPQIPNPENAKAANPENPKPQTRNSQPPRPFSPPYQLATTPSPPSSPGPKLGDRDVWALRGFRVYRIWGLRCQGFGV